VLLHDVKKRHGSTEVVIIILEGLVHRFAHRLKARKVDHAVIPDQMSKAEALRVQ
jgi:hypothetical protein